MWRDDIQSCGVKCESGLSSEQRSSEITGVRWAWFSELWPWVPADEAKVMLETQTLVILCILKAQRQYPLIHFPCPSCVWCILSPPLAFHCSISVISMVTQVEMSSFYLTPAKWGFLNWYFSCLFNLCDLSPSSALCRKVLQARGTHWVRVTLVSACFEPASCFHVLAHSSCAERLNNSSLFILWMKILQTHFTPLLSSLSSTSASG